MAPVVNLFGVLLDEEGEDANVVAESVERKSKALGAERERKLREEAEAEDKLREKTGDHFNTREYLKSLKAKGRGGRSNGGQPPRYDGQNYGNGRGDYSGRRDGGRGRSRGRGSYDQKAPQNVKAVNEVANEKQEQGVKEPGWNEVQQHQRRGSVPRDNKRAYQNGSRRFDGTRRDGHQSYGVDQSNASVEATEAQDNGDKAVAGGSDVVSEVSSVKENAAVDQGTAAVDELPKEAKNNGKQKLSEAAKEAAAQKAEEEEEAKKMTLEEYEKLLSEKTKALQALKVEERKVTLDKDLKGMQLVQKKKEEEIFVQLKSDKGKLKKTSSLDKEEKMNRKVLSINAVFKPAEGEVFSSRRDGARRGASDGGNDFVQGDFPRNDDGRRRDFTPRNGGGRDAYGPNGGGPRQDYGPRNNGGRGQYNHNGAGSGRPAESAHESQQGGRHFEGQSGRNGGTNSSYARLRGEGVRGRNVSLDDPSQFPALGGSAADKR